MTATSSHAGLDSQPPGAVPGLDSQLDPLLARLPSLAGRVKGVEPLAGGLTNYNYKVSTPDGSYVVRVGGQSAGHLAVDRENEYENSIAAAEAGVGAPVVDHLDEPSVLVVRYIEGKTLSAADLREGDYTQRVAAACRQLHSARRFRDDFDMFALQRRYLGLVEENGFRLPPGYHDFADAVEQMHDAMGKQPEPSVPCNNDLLAENFIDDGQKIWIIDYEYSGNNEPSFELGNIWSESDLSLEQLESLVAGYYGYPLRSKIARARLWGLMSKYGWTLWASIQDSLAQIDFDFWEWGMEKYERAVAEFKGPDFDTLLRDVAAGD